VDDAAFDVGQAEVATAVRVGQLFVVEAELVQDGGVQVVDVNFVLNGRESKVVGCAVNRATFDAASGYPHREPVRVVVSTVTALRRRRSAKFAAPDDQRFVEQASLLQISQQLSDRLIDVFAEFFVLLVVLAVRVPGLAISLVDLHETNTLFAEPPCQQARF
jgi:hypothetical protein